MLPPLPASCLRSAGSLAKIHKGKKKKKKSKFGIGLLMWFCLKINIALSQKTTRLKETLTSSMRVNIVFSRQRFFWLRNWLSLLFDCILTVLSCIRSFITARERERSILIKTVVSDLVSALVVSTKTRNVLQKCLCTTYCTFFISKSMKRSSNKIMLS